MTQRTPLHRHSARGPRLLGGIHRDVSGRPDEPLRFYLSVDRGLKSGKLDTAEVDERDMLRLIADAATALDLMRGQRS